MILTRAIPATVLLAAVACSARTPPSPAPQAPSTTLAPTTGSSATMNIRLTADGRVVNATLNDSAAARDFASLTPLTLNPNRKPETSLSTPPGATWPSTTATPPADGVVALVTGAGAGMALATARALTSPPRRS